MIKRNHLTWLVQLLCAAGIALALYTDFSLVSMHNYKNWGLMMQEHTLALFALTGVFAAFIRYAHTRFPRRGKGLTVFAIFLGAWWVLSQLYADDLEVVNPLLTSGQMLKVPVSFFGMSCLFDLLLRMLDDVLMRGSDLCTPFESSLPVRMYRKHPAPVCAAVIFLFWLPQLMIIYPGSMNADTAMQVNQAIGLVPYDGNHPPFSTVFVGAFVALGQALGHVNFGLFAYVLLQSMLAAAVAGYAQSVLQKLAAPRWLRLLTLVSLCISPCYADNVTVILKDVPYAFSAMLLASEMTRLCVLREEGYIRSAGFALRYAAAALVMTLFRNNGFGLLIPMAALLLVSRLRRRQFTARAALVLVLPLILSAGIGALVRTACDVQPGSIREGLSFPFQQTARFVREHQDEIPPEEAAIIDEVIDYKNLHKFYNQFMSDPVKATIRPDVTTGELIAYFGVWAKQFLRDPLCYLEATLIQNSLLFDPQTRNVAFFDNIGLYEDTQQLLGVYKPALPARLSAIEQNMRWLMFCLPGYAQLTSVGFFCILAVFVCILAAREHIRGLGPLMIIQLGTMVMIVLGPCLRWQDRYGFPVIYTMPTMLGCLAYLLRTKDGVSGEIK